MNIVVLAGGNSTERTVSLVTGTEACRALRRKGHKAILVDMFFGLEDYRGSLETIFDAPDGLCGNVAIESTAPDLAAIRASRKMGGSGILGKDVLTVCAMADLVFLGLHGECGEDGRIQAALDLLGVPYTGSGYLGSGMAMNKAITKHFMDLNGVRTPKWRDLTYTAADVERLTEELSVPCAVKVINGGSSVGVYLPDDKAQLRHALEDVLRYGNHVVVKEKIRGRELTVGVLGDRALPAVEIIPKSRYFDYESKYQSGGAQEICPANVTEKEYEEMAAMALTVHRMLGLAVYSRTDFILDENGTPWCLEVNTLPGLTPASLVPKEAAAVGIAYDDLCDTIARESLRVRKEH